MYEANFNEENTNQKPLNSIQRGIATVFTIFIFGLISVFFLYREINFPMEMMSYSILFILGLIFTIGGLLWCVDTLIYIRKQL